MGKGGDPSAVAAAPAQTDDKEILINGNLYDVSNFKHPGGSVIKFLTNGGDATEAFTEFHGRSRKAQFVLKALPKRPAPASVMKERGYNGKEELSRGYAKLRQELKEEGFFDPAPGHIAYRVAEVVAMHLIGGYFFMYGSSFGMQAFGLLVLGIVSGRCGWLMHEGGHYSLTGNIQKDRFLQIVIYGVGCGMSAAWWRNQHNKHHATPQKLKHDVDLDTLPLVAFNAEIAAKAKHPLLKLWLKYQALVFCPVSCLLVALGWQYYLHPRHILRTKRVHTEGLSVAIRHALFYGILCSGMTWGQSIGTYLAYNCVASSYIFSQFALSHSHLPVSGADEYLHWVEYAAGHTINVNGGNWFFDQCVDWWMEYLNYQIEHHLFPEMPQFRHPETSKRVKKFFAEHNIKYDQRVYSEACYATWYNLYTVGNEDHAKKE